MWDVKALRNVDNIGAYLCFISTMWDVKSIATWINDYIEEVLSRLCGM